MKPLVGIPHHEIGPMLRLIVPKDAWDQASSQQEREALLLSQIVKLGQSMGKSVDTIVDDLAGSKETA